MRPTRERATSYHQPWPPRRRVLPDWESQLRWKKEPKPSPPQTLSLATRASAVGRRVAKAPTWTYGYAEVLLSTKNKKQIPHTTNNPEAAKSPYASLMALSWA